MKPVYVSIWDIDRQVIFGNLKKALSLETGVFHGRVWSEGLGMVVDEDGGLAQMRKDMNK